MLQKATRCGDIPSIATIDDGVKDFLAECDDAYEFARLASRISRMLSIPQMAREAATWLHYGGVAMRKAGEYELACRFYHRAKGIGVKHGIDERVHFGSVGVFSAKALAGDFAAAGRTMRANDRNLPKDHYWIQNQNFMDRWRFSMTAGDRTMQVSSAGALRTRLIGVNIDELSRLKIEGIVASAYAMTDQTSRAYEWGLRSSYGLLVARREWAFVQYVAGLESGLRTFMSFETARAAVDLCQRARTEWSSSKSLSDSTYHSLRTQLGQLYRHYLDHHADGRDRYDNPYRALLPEESSLDKDFSEKLLTATNGYAH